MLTNEPEEIEPPQIINLSRVSVGAVQAELVRASQSAMQELNADEVELHSSAAASVQTKQFSAHESAIGTVFADQVNIHESLTHLVSAREVHTDGPAVAIVATAVTGDNIRTGLLISREVHGNVTTTFDARLAVLTGFIAGSVVGLILLAGRLLFRRKD